LRAEARRAFIDSETRKVLALSGFTPPYFPSRALRTALAQMVRAPGDDGVTPVIDLLKTVQPVLREWQARLAEKPNDPIQ
jgi:hypothetical protein